MGFELAMGILLILFIIGMAGAHISTARAVIPNKEPPLLCPFFRMAIVWHRIKAKRSKTLTGNGTSQKEQVLIRQFSSLDPTVSGQQQLAEFQMERTAKCLFCMFAGVVLSLLVSVAGEYGSVIQDGTFIARNDYGGGEVRTDLVAAAEGYEEPVALVIEERTYTKEETEELFRQVQTQMESIIPGDNETLAHVTKTLTLPRHIEGFPFDIVWESSAYDLVDMDGTVRCDDLTEPVPVTLTATFRYKEQRFYATENVVLYPPVYSGDEMFSHALAKALEKERELSAENSRFRLPQELPDIGRIDWKEAENRDGPVILFLTVLAVTVVFIMHDREIGSRVKERERELLMDYSEFVGKLTLYMGAGMTIRNVFMRLAEEYSRKKGTKKQYLYEEITLTCHELQMGISEADAYEHFGKRCKLRQYVRLTAFLTQNLKKGSGNLAQMLRQESRDAFESRKNMARKLGEEAGTKLLGPMIMMLCVVMVIIMIPAYLSFGM